MSGAGLPDLATTQAVLRFINLIRADLDLPPIQALPKGRPAGYDMCPVARGIRFGDLSLYVDVDPNAVLAISGRTTHIWSTPVRVGRFIEDFDGGRYLALDLLSDA